MLEISQIPSGTESQPHGLQEYSSQIPTAFKNFTMTQKDKTLEEFVRDQWLSSTSDGQIGLGIRSFLDLRSWFHNNEVPICEICNEAAVKVGGVSVLTSFTLHNDKKLI